jgi:hypothetical protein
MAGQIAIFVRNCVSQNYFEETHLTSAIRKYARLCMQTWVTIFFPYEGVRKLLIINNNLRNVIFCYTNCFACSSHLKVSVCISDEECLTSLVLTLLN